MTAGYKGIPLELIALPYEDEETPVKMTGKKALPILELENGEYLAESLKICSLLEDYKKDPTIYPDEVNDVLCIETFERIKNEWDDTIYKIAMPYWVTTDEFSEEGKKYFQTKKEASLGKSFEELGNDSTDLMIEMGEKLKIFEQELGDKDFFFDKFSLVDILIASHLKCLEDLPDWSFSSAIGMYMQRVRNLTEV